MGAQNHRMRFGRIAWVLFLVATVFCLWVGPALAGGVAGGGDTAYYVDISAPDDNGDGAEGNPFKFLHTAFGALQPGDTLYVLPGVYSVANGEADASITWYNGSLHIIGDGPTGSVIIDGVGANFWYSGIRFYSESEPFVKDVLIKNLDIRNFTIPGSYDTGNGILIEGVARDISILNCRIYHNAQAGIYLNGSRHRVQGCEIYDNGYEDAGTLYPGVGISAMSDNNLISGNRVYWSGAAAYPQGIGVAVFSGEWEVGTRVHSNEIYGHTSGPAPSGIQIDYEDAQIFDNDIHDNTTGVRVYDSSPDIHRNIVKDNTTGIRIEYYYSSGSPRIINNLILGSTDMPSTTSIGIDVYAPSAMDAQAVLIYHNTIYGAADKAIQTNVVGAMATAPDILYNIFSHSIRGYSIFQAESSNNPTIGYNLFYDGGSANYLGDYFIVGSGLQTLPGTNLTGQDPLFVDAANDNFRLQPDSQAIDFIATADHNLAVFEDFDRVSRPQGNYKVPSEGYDMGCFEAIVFYYPTITWTGAVNNNWSESGNWDPDTPDSNDRVHIPAGSDVSVDTDATVLSLENHGALNIPSGKTLTVEGEGSFLVNAPDGTLKGEGILDATVHLSSINYGIIAPGTSAGTFTVNGDARSDASSRLNIEIGGTVPGTMFDKLIINGHLACGGEIFVSLIDDYEAEIGHSFEIINFTSLTELPNSVILPPLPDGRIWRQTLDTGSTPNRFILEVIAVNAGGTGTPSDPYLIATPEHLNHVRKLADRHFRQIADIDLSGYAAGMGWDPIGEDGSCFSGSYDGNGYTISSLSIDRPGESNVGLFGCVTGPGIFKNINVEVNSVIGYENVGALVGWSNYEGGSIRIVNCSVISSGAGGAVIVDADNGWNAGGLVGYNQAATVERCRADVDVSGYYGIGGLVGCNYRTISQSFAAGNVSGTWYIGGLVGENFDPKLINCYAWGSVVGDVDYSSNVGGLAGWTSGDVVNCYAVGSVSGIDNLGGLIGNKGTSGNIINSYYNSSNSNNGYGTPKTLTELKQGAPSIDIYTDWYPFIWDFDPTPLTDAYPVLRWTGWDIPAGWTFPASMDDTVNAEPWPQNPIMSRVAVDDANGDTLIVWAQNDGTDDRVYKNEYRSATGLWSGPTAISPSAHAADPHPVMDANGNALIVWRQFDGGIGVDRVYLYEYRSGGPWTGPTAVSPDATNVTGAPHAAMGDDGRAVIAWAQYYDATDANKIYKSEYRSGWTHPADLDDHVDSSWAQPPHVAADNNGNAVIVWEQAEGGIYMTEYRNPGPNWEAAALISPTGSYADTPRAVMSDNGDTVVAWRQQNNAGYWQIFKSEYRAPGPWTHPVDRDDHISKGDVDAEPPSVAIDGLGNALVVWSQDHSIFMSEYRDGAWTNPASLYDFIGPYGYNAQQPHVAMDAAGNAVVTWYNGDDDAGLGWISLLEFRSGAWRHPVDMPPEGQFDINGYMPYSSWAAMADNGEAVIAWDLYVGEDPDTYQDIWRLYKSEYRTGGPPDQYVLTAEVYPSDQGTVVSVPAGIDCPAVDCDAPFDDGTDVELTAAPALGGPMGFAYWLIDGQPDRITDNPLTVNMDEAHKVTAVFSLFAAGIGTQAEPFQVETDQQLVYVGEYPDSHFILNNNINLDVPPWNQDKGWVPIGTSDKPFTGVFNANVSCRLITGLYVDRPDEDYVGLFGYVGPGAVIGNLRIEDADVSGKDAVGVLAGKNDGGAISICAAAGTVTGNGSDTGGVGGLVGYNAGTIIDSYAAVHVTATGSYIGGLVGKNFDGVIDGVIENAYSSGRVQGASDVGGLVCTGVNSGTVIDSYWNTETSGQSNSGGGNGLSSAQMRLAASFSGWVFIDTWEVVENNDFPWLQCLGQVLFSLNYVAGPNGNVVGTPYQSLRHGEDGAAVEAVANAGYEFAGWTGDYVGTTNPLTISNVTANMTIYANFRRIPVVTTWVVRFEASNGGRVDGDTVQVINNGGSTRSVEAVSNAGYAFDRWTGSYNGTANPLILNNITSNMTITANFRRVPPVETHTVNFIAGAGGTISGSTAQVVAHGGSTSAVTAVPDPDHEFAGWSGDYTATTDSLTITNVTSSMTVHANFRRIEVIAYTVNFIAGAAGRIDGNTAQTVAEGGDCAPVTAVADEGFEFIGWGGDADGTDAALTVTNVTANMTIYADFQEQEPVAYTVAFSAGTGGRIDGNTTQTVEEGNDCAPVTAVADPGYTFSGWSGDAGGTAATLTVTNVTADMNISALFDENAGNRPPERPLPVSPSEDGVVPAGFVTLRSGLYTDPENDPHVRSWWQVFLFGSSEIAYEIRTESDLTAHTIPGLAPGVKYTWRVAYQDAGSGEYTWSETETFIVGTPAVDENIPPVDPGTMIGDYRMVSFVSWLVPSSAESVFGPLLPEGYDPTLLRIGTYDPILGGYREYPDFSVEPGRSYWFLAREGMDLSVEGIPVSTGVDFCITLGFNPANEDGWNMIAPPNARSYAWGDLVVTAADGAGNPVSMPVALLTPDNPYIDVRIWEWNAGDYDASDAPGFVLEAYNGYWVRAKQAGVSLCFPADAPVAMRAVDAEDRNDSLILLVSAWLAGLLPDTDTAHAEVNHDKPPMPMSALEDGVGGSQGCFIETIATEGDL